MSKQVISFVCQECGYDSPQWLGKCPECGNWNTFKEFRETKSSSTGKTKDSGRARMTDVKPEPLSKVQSSPKQRISTGFSEMDNVMGGGIVAGSVTLLAGDPGIGKSTLLLQLALNLCLQFTVYSLQKDKATVNHEPTNQLTPKKVLYVSGEESKEQVALRATRLTKVLNSNLLLLSMSNSDEILQIIEDTKPSIVVIDSIQTMESEEAGGLSGSVSQIRYGATQFIRAAKSLNIPFILVGHVTKEGMVAGPMTLSHMVDTVLFLEGEKLTPTRILRSFKNRFGPVDEVGIFQMNERGMTEVKNPEQIFLSSQENNIPGSVLVSILEGTRPFLVEIQALVVYSKFPMPKRVASGVDQRRVELLIAVLQKHSKLPLENYDVFVNIAGGAKVNDRAVDLGICIAIWSSLKNITTSKIVAVSEVGLLGELRIVPGLSKRVKEAEKLGFRKVITAERYKTLTEVLKKLT